MLVLGGGDGLAAREVLRYPEVDEVVQVELDPAVTRLAAGMGPLVDLNRGALDDPRLTVVHDDAFTWVAEQARAGARPAFDVVIADFPDPDRLDLARLYSEEMYRAIGALLAPDGRLVVQAGSPYFARHAFWCVDTTVRSAGFETVPYHVDVPSFGDWGFVLASRTPLSPALDRQVPTRFLTSDVLAAAQVFAADVAPVDVDPNTLDAPVLVDYTNRGWSSY